MTVDKNDEGIFLRAEQELNELGFSTLRFDFRAHGESSGDSTTDFTIDGEIKDLECIIDYLKKQNMDWIGLAGASFGGGIAALFSGLYPDQIQALILVNPALDYKKTFLEPTTPWAKKYFSQALAHIRQEGFVKIGSRQFGIGIRLIEQMNKYFPFKTLEEYKNPLLIIHGTKDSKVSYEDTLEIFNTLSHSNKHFETIDEAEHGFHEEPFETEVTKIIVDFYSYNFANN